MDGNKKHGKKGTRGPGAGHKAELGRARKDEREAVLLALLSHEKKDIFSNVLVKRTLDDCADLSDTERAFVKRLLEGVIERRTELDAAITHYTGRAVSRLHPVVLQALRMGIYQIRYMNAVPDSAACNESVRLVKRHGPAGLAGLVNGVLRNAARDAQKDARKEMQEDGQPGIRTDARDDGQSGARTDAREDRKEQEQETRTAEKEPRLLELCVRYSTPEWLVRMWEEQLGLSETERLLESFMEVRPVSIRLCGDLSPEERALLLDRIRGAGAQIEEGRWLGDSLRLRRTSDLRRLPGFEQGRWTVQDESSMLAVTAAGLQGSETVYDVCAAPGGKSFYAADLLLRAARRHGSREPENESVPDSGMPAAAAVRSFDLTRRKTDRIREGAARLHLTGLYAEERDARTYEPSEEGAADVLLCDLPCSGLGVIGKKRDIKYRASREGILSLQALQREILRSAVHYLRQGGVLIYSTCTISREENEDNAEWIRSELGLQPEDLSLWLPKGIPGIRGNMLQLLPHVHGTDGFFIARFRKT